MKTGAPRCSFCGKGEDQVKRLVAGEKAIICNECVAVAARIMKEAKPGDPPVPAWPAPPR